MSRDNPRSTPVGLRYVPAIVTLLVATALSVGAFRTVRAQLDQAAEAEFMTAAQELASVVEGAVEGQLLILEAMHAMYSVGGAPRPGFRALVEPILSQMGDIQSLEWVVRVTEGEREAFEEARRAQGLTTFQITERRAQGVMVRASSRAEYYPVFPLGLMDPGDPSVGFDVASDSTRRIAMDAARDRGEMRATERVTLVRESVRGEYGFLVFAPVYVDGVVPQTVLERRAGLRGFVLGVFRFRDMIETALSVFDTGVVDIQLVDDSAAPSQRILFTQMGDRAVAPDAAAVVPRPRRSLEYVRSFEVGGRPWSLTVRAADSWAGQRRQRIPWLVFIGGLTIGVLLAGYLGMSARHTARQGVATRALTLANEELGILNQVIMAGSRSTDVPSLLRSLMDCTVEALDFDCGGIYLIDAERNVARLAVEHRGHDETRHWGSAVPISTHPFSAVFVDGETLIHDGARPNADVGRGYDCRAVVSVPLLAGERVIGALNVGSCERESITGREEKILRLIGQQLGTLVTRKQATDATKASLEEKEVLLKEVHHRVKNNLQIIASLHVLQAQNFEDSQAHDLFMESHSRIISMALIHEHLYQAENLAKIEVGSYAAELSSHLAEVHGSLRRGVLLEVDAPELFLPVDKAIPLGMILNELISNSLVHGYPDGRVGRIGVEIRSGEEGRIELVVNDDGVGFPASVDIDNPDSLGLQLVASLVGQLTGTIDLDRTNGTTVLVTFAI